MKTYFVPAVGGASQVRNENRSHYSGNPGKVYFSRVDRVNGRHFLSADLEHFTDDSIWLLRRSSTD